MDKFYYSDGTTSSERDYSKVLHREDGPAVEYSYGTKEWWFNGKRHRKDGPAIEGSNGDKYWYINDKLHREDGPAREWGDGSVQYWLNNEKYSKEDFDKKNAKMKKPKKPKKDKFYYSDGTTSSVRDYSKILHREDGPAVEFSDGAKYWFINGQRHREDGPACEWSDGTVQYWLNNILYSKEDFDKLTSKVSKKESTMKEKVIQNFKNDSKKAIVRSGANKLTKTAKSAIVMASSKLSSEQAELVQKMVSSEKGEAGLRLALGYLLTYLPLGSLADNPKVQLMAEEFRVSGQTIVQDEVIEKLSSIFIPMIQSVVESMPEIEVNVTKKQPKAKTRVAQIKEEKQQMEEQEESINNVVSMKISK